MAPRRVSDGAEGITATIAHLAVGTGLPFDQLASLTWGQLAHVAKAWGNDRTITLATNRQPAAPPPRHPAALAKSHDFRADAPENRRGATFTIRGSPTITDAEGPP